MANELLQPGIRSGYEVNGPAAGVMADQQYSNWMEQQARINRDSDLANQMQQNAYQNQLLDNPVKAAERDLKQQQIAGDVQTLPSKIEETIAKQAQGKTEAELKVADSRAQFLTTAAEVYPKELFADPIGQARGQKIWDDQKEQAKKLGVKFPEGPFSPESVAELRQRGQASAIYLKHRQAMDIEKMKEEKVLEAARIGAGSRVEAAKITASAAGARQEGSMTDINRIITEMDRKVKSGEPLTQEDIEKAKVAYKANKTPAEQAPLMKARDEMAATFLADPKKAKEAAKEVGLPENASPSAIAGALYDKELDKQADEWVKSRFPGAKITGSTSTPKAAATSKAPAKMDPEDLDQKSVEAYGVKYDPKKKYRRNPKTGALQAQDR